MLAAYVVLFVAIILWYGDVKFNINIDKWEDFPTDIKFISNPWLKF
jgi:hypothetical protein